MDTIQEIGNIYYDIAHPAGYGSIQKLSKVMQDKMNKVEVMEWLRSQETYSLHRLVQKKFYKGTDVVKSRKYDERIVGGNPVDIEFHPYQADVQDNCGGSIIGRRWILTAAHCDNVDIKTVYVGSSSAGKGTPYSVRSAIQMPLYFKANENEGYFDFMLLELNKPLVYGPTVRPIQLGREEDIVVGEYAIATGYGMTDGYEDSTTRLRRVALRIMDYYKCNQMYGGTLLPNVICAGYEKGKTPCSGDSGGPLVLDGKLLGVTSYGKRDCTKPGDRAYPAIFGSVPRIRSWIRRVTGIE